MIDETDAADISVLRRRDDVAERPIVVRTTLEPPVLVKTTAIRPVIVEPTLDPPVAVPVMRDGDVAEAMVAAPAQIEPPLDAAPPPQLQIGPFQIADLSRDDVVAAIVNGAMASRTKRAWVTFALHVGGLNQRRDRAYLQAMSSADLVYADGMSVIVLAKLAGAGAAERAGTTDIGWTVLRELSRALDGRPGSLSSAGLMD